jgi:transposase-like protein
MIACSTNESFAGSARAGRIGSSMAMHLLDIIRTSFRILAYWPLGLRMVEELLAAGGIIVSHETVRQWAGKFGQPFANQIRRRLPRTGDKWHLDGVSRTRF